MLPQGATSLYYVEDSLGSSRVIAQNNGTLCYDADFTPFGGERPYTNSCPQNYKFEGKERDAETGNDDFDARYYSNRFGRWLSADWSNVPAPVPYANLTNPQTLNLYAMVADDPESFADLDGHRGGNADNGCEENGPAGCADYAHMAAAAEAERKAEQTGEAPPNCNQNCLARTGTAVTKQNQSPTQKYIEQQNRPATETDKANALVQAGKMGDAGVKAGLVVVGAEAAVSTAVVAAPAVIPAVSSTATQAYVATTTALAAAGTAINNAATAGLNLAKQAVITIDTLKSGGGAINAAANFVQGYRASTSLAPRQPPPQTLPARRGF